MKNRFGMVVAALVAGMLFLAACGGGSSAPAPQSGSQATPAGSKSSTDAQKFALLKGDPVNGKAKYETTCIACHGPDLKGLPNLGKNLTTSTFLKGLSDADAVLFLTKGRPASDPLNTTHVDMPPRGGNPALKDQDLADIIAYVRTMQK